MKLTINCFVIPLWLGGSNQHLKRARFQHLPEARTKKNDASCAPVFFKGPLSWQQQSWSLEKVFFLQVYYIYLYEGESSAVSPCAQDPIRVQRATAFPPIKGKGGGTETESRPVGGRIVRPSQGLHEPGGL